MARRNHRIPKTDGQGQDRSAFKKPSIVLADDHRMVAESLKSLLEPQFDVVRIVEDGEALVIAVQECQPEIVVTDISMPLLNGVEAACRIREMDNPPPIVILTTHLDIDYATRAFEAGASAYVLKQAASSELTTAINEVLEGRTYLSPVIALDLMHAYKQLADQRDGLRLTSRQREVLQLLTRGFSTKEIASTMHISRRTVEFHKYRMMEHLEIKSLAALVCYAIEHGIGAG